MPFSFPKLIQSFHYAFRGVIRLLKNEQNARIHASAAILVGVAAYVFGITRVEATILFIAVIMVFAMEIINTSIEKLCDVVHPDRHDTIEYIKDGMAGAVLIASIIALVVAILIFLPYIRNLCC